VRALRIGPLASSLAQIAYRTLCAPPGMAYAAADILWFLLVFIVAPRRAPTCASSIN
jgi:hypothetical protein